MESESFSHHISRRFNAELEHLRSEVLRMGGLVEQHLDTAVEAITSGDSEMGLRVSGDDFKINRLEVSIDEECSKLLATRMPAAADLRLIVTVIKIISRWRLAARPRRPGVGPARCAASRCPAAAAR